VQLCFQNFIKRFFLVIWEHTLSLYGTSVKFLEPRSKTAKGAAIKFFQHTHTPMATFLMQLGSQETENMERGVEDEETGRDCIESEWNKLSGRG
jgi:hypothetical protein